MLAPRQSKVQGSEQVRKGGPVGPKTRSASAHPFAEDAQTIAHAIEEACGREPVTVSVSDKGWYVR